MIDTKSQISESDIKRFLYGEMTDEERSEFEQRLFENDEVFYEIVDLENELVDRYTAGKLTGDERARFERGLERVPERRGKVANAAAIQTYIADERPEEEYIETLGFWQKLAGLFTVRAPAFGFSMAGLLLLFAISSLFLYLDNRRKSDELARLQHESEATWKQREAELQDQLTISQQRESELRSQIDAERETSGDLGDELSKETARRTEIENELERLRRPTATQQPQAPVIAFISLSPIGTRGGPRVVQEKTVPSGTKRIAARLTLPEPTAKGARFSARLNGAPVAQDLAARTSNGVSSIQVVIPANDLNDGVNLLSVMDAAGTEVTSYAFKVSKK